ncbi:tetratricopeptide repeat protein [Anaerobacillus sp. CMMVII]|uniref:tetratricopeptide repeat protein n=1 Tax=Anaerobacillus sp. CMMVII TaxID=2755588 RepID=UPI0021B7C3A9|nr:tetratricopeptide repeat protein [Anaerobacillus sp. CMMVII]MCT8138926.1 tetratricopeptide repeat protein [Anaerobacillus sp. CMMVII]
MEKWVNDWHTRYWKLKKSIENNSLNENLYEELAKECGALLETWMEMEDKLDDIKELKAQTNFDSHSFALPKNLEGPTYFHLEMFEKAIDTLKTEIETEKPHELTLYLYLGFSYLYEGEIDRGKEAFLFVVQTSVNRLEKHFAYVGLGCLYGRTHQYEDAIHYFEKANSLYNNIDVPYNIGMAFVMLQKYELAIPYFEQTIKANDEDGEARYFLGHCYLKLGNETKAFESWYAALQLLEYKDLLVTIAYEFENFGYYSAAIHCYKRLEALGFQEPWVYHGIAWNYGLLDEKELAISMFEKLLAENEKETNIWISYLWLSSKWNDIEHFETLVKKAKKENIDHPLIDKILS